MGCLRMEFCRGGLHFPLEVDRIWLWVYYKKTPHTPYSVYSRGTTYPHLPSAIDSSGHRVDFMGTMSTHFLFGLTMVNRSDALLRLMLATMHLSTGNMATECATVMIRLPMPRAASKTRSNLNWETPKSHMSHRLSSLPPP